MKPIKLTMTAFQAYGGTETIDFQKIGDRGLLLITGNTGAGKTTIFDAMTYALYGRPSGSVRPVDSIRSHFAEETTDTVVEFTFINRGKTYAVSRSPARAKAKGVSKRSKETSLNMPDGSVVTADAQVTKEIEKILGLDERQWAQVIMLAQGEFVKLLNSDSKERAEIFQKIFQTQNYRAIQEKLKDRYSEFKEELQQDQINILNKVGDIEYPEDSEQYPKFVFIRDKGDPIYNREEVYELIDFAIRADNELKAELNQKRETIQSQRDKLLGEKIGAEALAEDFKLLRKNKEDIEVLEKQKPDMDNKAACLAKSEKAIDHVKPIFDRSSGINQELETNCRKKVELEQTKIDLQGKLAVANEKLRLAKEGAEEIPELIGKIASIDSSLPKYRSLTEKNSLFQNSNNKLQGLMEKRDRLVLEKETKDSGKREHIEFVNNHLSLKDDLYNTKIEKEKIDAKTKRVKGLLDEIKKYYLVRSQREERSKEYEALEKERKASSDEVNAAEERFYRSQAGLIAEKLEEGMPCPVCGSTHHPLKATISGDVPSEKYILELKRKREIAEGKVGEVRELISTIDGKIGTVADNIKKEESDLEISAFGLPEKECIAFVHGVIDGCEVQSGECDEKYARLEKTSIEYNSRSEKLMALDNEVIRLNGEIENANSQITKLSGEVSSYKTSVEEISKNIQYSSEEEAIRARNGFSSKRETLEKANSSAQTESNSIENQLIENGTSLKNVNDRIDELSFSKKELDKEFKDALTEQGFTDADEFGRFVMDRGKLKLEKEVVRAFNEKYEQTKNGIIGLESKLENKKEPDVAAIEERYAALGTEIIAADDKALTVGSRVKNNIRNRDQLTSLYRKHDKTELETMSVKKMSDTANGTLKGAERVTFEQYVQGVYFDEVIARASIRLGKMSNNRFELIRKKEPEHLGRNTSLDMEVLDNHSGKMRSVRSLSGGESFKAALSLALGLSDTIQTRSGGVDIETLFIDEGFGSLDADSLDQAISVLEQLSIDNTLVGIISHVDSLKERIDKKIVVSHDESGSRAEIVVD